jgi:hypothetical protein
MSIIAFDIGANMAAAYRADGDITVEYCGFDGGRPARAAGTLTWLGRVMDRAKAKGSPPPAIAFYERPFARGHDATRSLWGIAGLLEAVAASRGHVVFDASPTSIKRWATGKGDASKWEMMAAACKHGYLTANEHMADAFLALLYAESLIGASLVKDTSHEQ